MYVKSSCFSFSSFRIQSQQQRPRYTPYREDCISAFLQVLSELFPIDSIEERLDDDPCLVSINAVLKALGTDGDGLFDAEFRSGSSFSELYKTIKENGVGVKGKSSTDRYVDFDLLLSNVMRTWYGWVVPQDQVKEVEGVTKEGERVIGEDEGAAEEKM